MEEPPLKIEPKQEQQTTNVATQNENQKREIEATEKQDKEQIKAEVQVTEKQDKEQIKAEVQVTEKQDKEQIKAEVQVTEKQDKEQIKAEVQVTEKQDKEQIKEQASQQTNQNFSQNNVTQAKQSFLKKIIINLYEENLEDEEIKTEDILLRVLAKNSQEQEISLFEQIIKDKIKPINILKIDDFLSKEEQNIENESKEQTEQEVLSSQQQEEEVIITNEIVRRKLIRPTKLGTLPPSSEQKAPLKCGATFAPLVEQNLQQLVIPQKQG